MKDIILPYFATFVSTNYVTLGWQGDQCETIGIALQAAQILSLRIRVERFTITTTSYDEWGLRGEVNYQPATPDELSARMDLTTVVAQEDLQLRIALPPGAFTEPPWVTIDPDLQLREAKFTPSEPLAGYPTGWLDPLIPIGPGFEVDIEELGEVEVMLLDGPFAFDPRPSETFVRGSSLAQWIAADRMLQQHVINKLQKIGFRRQAPKWGGSW